jgi:hypothetical protein
MQYVIWSWHHQGWWKPDALGYCDTLEDAGRFDEAAVAGFKARERDGTLRSVVIPVSAIGTAAGARKVQ